MARRRQSGRRPRRAGTDRRSPAGGPAAGKRLNNHDRGLHQSWAPWITGAPAQVSIWPRRRRIGHNPAQRRYLSSWSAFANQLSANTGSVARQTERHPPCRTTHGKPCCAPLPQRSASAPLTTAAASAADPLKVGFVYIGPIGDHGWTYQHEQGRKYMEEKLGDKVKTSFVENVPGCRCRAGHPQHGQERL